MRLTFRLDLNLGTEEVSEKLILGAWTGEKMWHVVLKLLGYLLFYEYRPRVEEGIGWHYKPDLVSLDERGVIDLWVDCGNIGPRKIERVAIKVARRDRFFILKRHRREAERLRQLLNGKIKYPDRVHLIAFDDHVVDELAAALDGINRLTATRSNDRLELLMDNRRGESRFSTAIHRLD